MNVQPFMIEESLEVNLYVVTCEETSTTWLVDCGAFDPAIPAYLNQQGLTLSAIFITHGHWDHVTGLPDAVAFAGDIPVYAFAPEHQGVKTTVVKPGDTLRLGAHEGVVRHTPGHTPDGVSLLFPGHAFTGDALFCGSVGGTNTTENYEQQLAAIRTELFPLPDNTRVYSGHGPVTTIGIEKRFNPFFV